MSEFPTPEPEAAWTCPGCHKGDWGEPPENCPNCGLHNVTASWVVTSDDMVQIWPPHLHHDPYHVTPEKARSIARALIYAADKSETTLNARDWRGDVLVSMSRADLARSSVDRAIDRAPSHVLGGGRLGEAKRALDSAWACLRAILDS